MTLTSTPLPAGERGYGIDRRTGDARGAPEIEETVRENGAFIVAEISKNWVNGWPADGRNVPISEIFEEVLNVNHRRGYRLLSFQLHRVNPDPESLNETIVAVFERIDVLVGEGAPS